jgi:hypothetical protein
MKTYSHRGGPGSSPGPVTLALRQVSSEYFGFPCQSSFHQLLHNHPHLSSGTCTVGQCVAAVPSGLVSPTQLIIIIKIMKTYGEVEV